MIRRFATVAASTALLLAAGSATVAASKPKPRPLAYLYGQCSTTTNCTSQASTNPQQNKIAISVTGSCPTGAQALGEAGFAKVKRGGKFSLAKTLSVENGVSYQKISVHVQFSGTLKPGKKVTGSYTITTTASDCTADTGVKKPFSMKYIGPSYGG